MARLSSAFGCENCGLIGCKCAAKEVIQARATAPCSVCRRSERNCICVSHSPHREMHDETIDRALYSDHMPRRPFTDAHLETLVQEGLHYYYARDAEGLARWIRRRVA